MTVVTRLSTSSIRSPRRLVYRCSRSLSGAGSLGASSTTGTSGTEGERAQRPGAAGPLDRRMGAPARHRLLRLPSAGWVSATDVHDAGRRRGGIEPIDDVPCVVEGGSPGPLERKAVEEGNGLRTAAAPAPALAYGYLVFESGRDVLLPVLVSGWREPGGGSLGDSRINDGSGCGVHLGAGEGAVPASAASNHLGQTILSTSRRTSRRSSASQG